MSGNYNVADYVTDLRDIVRKTSDDAEIISRVRPLAKKLALNREAWIRPEHFEVKDERGSSLYVLHEEPDHTLMVFAACFRPGRVTPVHDHGTWAVVAGVAGEERNTIYSRVDDGSTPGYGKLEKRGDKVFRAGDVLGMPSGVFHTVSNETAENSVSLHTYGVNTNFTVRCQIDPATGKVEDFKIPLRQGQ